MVNHYSNSYYCITTVTMMHNDKELTIGGV